MAKSLYQLLMHGKVGHGQPRSIISANLVGTTSSMLNSKLKGNWRFGSREEDIQIVLTIYGLGGHLSHVTITICTIFG